MPDVRNLHRRHISRQETAKEIAERKAVIERRCSVLEKQWFLARMLHLAVGRNGYM